MRKLLLATLTLTNLLLLNACSKVHMGPDESPAFIQTEASSDSGIVGGTRVPEKDDIAHITVQIFTLQVQKDNLGRLGITGVSSCTGSILAEDIILTAAHCTSDNPNYIFLYFSVLPPEDMKEFIASVPTNPLVRRVIGGKVGSNWPKLSPGQAADWGDIALLKFKGGLPEGFHTAQLLPSTVELKAQQSVTLAGFGLTNGVTAKQAPQLLKVEVNILEPNYSKSEMIVDSGNGKGPCHGDSGGPAYVIVNGQRYISGTTSRAERKTDPKGLCIGDTVYTKVQPYAGWIKNTMKVLQSPQFKATLIPQPR